MTNTRFDKIIPSVEAKMREIEDSVLVDTSLVAETTLKPLPKELVSGDTNSQIAFTVRIEKDLKERLSFLVLLLKRSGDKNISVASTVGRILRNSINLELKDLGYDSDGENI